MNAGTVAIAIAVGLIGWAIWRGPLGLGSPLPRPIAVPRPEPTIPPWIATVNPIAAPVVGFFEAFFPSTLPRTWQEMYNGILARGVAPIEGCLVIPGASNDQIKQCLSYQWNVVVVRGEPWPPPDLILEPDPIIPAPLHPRVW